MNRRLSLSSLLYNNVRFKHIRAIYFLSSNFFVFCRTFFLLIEKAFPLRFPNAKGGVKDVKERKNGKMMTSKQKVIRSFFLSLSNFTLLKLSNFSNKQNHSNERCIDSFELNEDKKDQTNSLKHFLFRSRKKKLNQGLA